MCGLVGLVAAGLSILLVGLVVSSLLVGLLLRSELLRSCSARDLLHGRPARGAELLTVGYLRPAFRTEHSHFLLDELCINGTALRQFVVQALVSRELMYRIIRVKMGHKSHQIANQWALAVARMSTKRQHQVDLRGQKRLWSGKMQPRLG